MLPDDLKRLDGGRKEGQAAKCLSYTDPALKALYDHDTDTTIRRLYIRASNWRRRRRMRSKNKKKIRKREKGD